MLHEGQPTFTAGETALAATAGQVVAMTAGVPHEFVNAGDDPLHITSVQRGPWRIGEWRED